MDFLIFCSEQGHNGVAEGGCIQVMGERVLGLGDGVKQGEY